MPIIQLLVFSRIVHITTMEFINETLILGRRHTMINVVLLENLRGTFAYTLYTVILIESFVL